MSLYPITHKDEQKVLARLRRQADDDAALAESECSAPRTLTDDELATVIGGAA